MFSLCESEALRGLATVKSSAAKSKNGCGGDEVCAANFELALLPRALSRVHGRPPRPPFIVVAGRCWGQLVLMFR